MALREFTDTHGRRWRVWTVYPQHVERRERRERRATGRAGPDRRQRALPLYGVAPQYRQGWLAFEWYQERRRLCPIPEGWESLPDAALERMLDRATTRPARGRLIE